MMEGAEALNEAIASQTTMEQVAMEGPELPPPGMGAEGTLAGDMKTPEELSARAPGYHHGTPLAK